MRKLVLLLLLTSAAFAADPPKTVIIRGNDWTVDWTDKPIKFGKDEYWGYTLCDQRILRIYSGSQDLREVLMHEAMHADTCDSHGDVHNLIWNSKSEEEHKGIDRIAAFWLEFLRNNPAVVDWILNR